MIRPACDDLSMETLSTAEPGERHVATAAQVVYEECLFCSGLPRSAAEAISAVYLHHAT